MILLTRIPYFCSAEEKQPRIKGLVWEGDGFLLLYKRLEVGAFAWPRTESEALAISAEQYQRLMSGFAIVAKHPISELKEPKEII